MSMDSALQIAEWRRKVADKTITKEELKEALRFLRANRAAVPKATGGSKSRAKAPVNADDLLAGLGELPL